LRELSGFTAKIASQVNGFVFLNHLGFSEKLIQSLKERKVWKSEVSKTETETGVWDIVNKGKKVLLICSSVSCPLSIVLFGFQ